MQFHTCYTCSNINKVFNSDICTAYMEFYIRLQQLIYNVSISL